MEDISAPINGQAAARGLARRMLGGGSLILGAAISARALTFVSTIVLARVLAPSDFGLMSLAMLVFQLVSLITDRGLPQAVVQSRSDLERVANTGFVLMSVIGFAVCGAIMLASPLIGQFLGSEALAPVLVVLAVGCMIYAFGRVPVAVLDKSLQYRRRALPDTLASLAQTVVSIALAVGSQGALGVWALAWGSVAYWVAWSAVGWAASGWRPSWQLDRGVARDLLHFTRDFAAVALMIVLIRSIDHFAVGKFLGPAQLGFYAMAYRVSHLPRDVLSASMNRVLFPALASLQDQPGALRTLHRYGTKLEAALSFPLVVLLVIAAPDLVPLVFGDKWSPAILPLQILAASGLAQSLIAVDQSITAAVGQRRRLYPGAVATLLLVALFLVPALQYGIVGVAAAVAAALVIGLVISQFIAAGIVGVSYREYVSPLLAPALAAGVSGAAASWLFHSLFGALSLPLLAFMSGAMLLCYAAVLLVTDADARFVVVQARSRAHRQVSRTATKFLNVGP